MSAALLLLLSPIIVGHSTARPAVEADDAALAGARRRMVERDLRRRGIKDERVLQAMNAVPRHLFVPESLRDAAYEDRPLPIGERQTISQPYIVAVMTEALALKEGDRVLEIGTGSGYQAAVLARLVSRVYSIEIVPALAARAKKTLEELGVDNVEVRIGDGFFGWEEKAPFDAILLTAASPRVPEPLWRQLKDGGRLLLPEGEQGRPQRLMLYVKTGDKPVATEISGVLFVPLTGEIRKREP